MSAALGLTVTSGGYVGGRRRKGEGNEGIGTIRTPIRQRNGPGGLGDGLHRKRVLEIAELDATVLRGDGDSEQAHVPELLPHVLRD